MTEQHIVKDVIEGILGVDMQLDMWDTSPLLYFVLNPDPEVHPEKHRVMQALSDRFWTIAPPPDLIMTVAMAMTDPNAPLQDPFIPFVTTDRFVGLVFRTEGWMLSGDGSNKEEIEQFTRSGGRIVDHPDRIECKMYVGVTAEGQAFNKTQPRGREAEPWMEGGDGRLYEALSMLVTNVNESYRKAGAFDGPLG